ncbi:hypothetical protein GGI21_005407, partial [Coemansia aciculifera]
MLDNKPATQARASGSRWSNHWRMQSLLQSALADDKRRLESQIRVCQSDVGADMSGLCSSLASNADSIAELDTNAFCINEAWLSDWPTCREVDIDDAPLIPCDGLGDKHFYTQLDSSISLEQHVDPVSDTGDILRAILSENDTTTQQEPLPEPAIWPVIVDVDLINCIEADTRDNDGVYIDGEGNDSGDSSGIRRPCYSPAAESESAGDSDDFDDLRTACVQDKLPGAEEEHTTNDCTPAPEMLYSSKPPRGTASISQLDGADDSGDLDNSALASR